MLEPHRQVSRRLEGHQLDRQPEPSGQQWYQQERRQSQRLPA